MLAYRVELAGEKENSMETIPETLYHYTSLQTLTYLQNWDGINEKEKHVLNFSASGVESLNDTTEYLNYIQNKDIVHKGLHSFAGYGKPFIISLSYPQENIPMWNMYGDNGRGVCLEFASQQLCKHFEIVENNNIDQRISIRRCLYQKTEKFIALEKEFCKPANPQGPWDMRLFHQYAIEAIALKNNVFEYENEWRIIKFSEQFKTRPSGVGITPFINIPIPMECLRRIIVGPKATMQSERLVDAWIYQYNHNHGTGAIEVEKSRLPFQ